jgi:hypothetical protein
MMEACNWLISVVKKMITATPPGDPGKYQQGLHAPLAQVAQADHPGKGQAYRHA